MSQTGQYLVIASGGGVLQTLTGDDLVIVNPDGAGNIDVFALDGTNNSGSTVSFSGGLNKIVLNVSDTTLLNTFIGANAGNLTLTNTQNTGIGIDVLSSLTSGQRNTAVGYQAGMSLQNGLNNVLIGRHSGLDLIGGSSNSTLGDETLANGTTASGNVVIGHLAGNDISSGANNMIVGTNAANDLTTGSSNVVLGHSALGAGLTASNNVIIGTDAGDFLDSGTFNILIGEDAGSNYTGAESNNIVLANQGILGDGGAIRLGDNGTHTTAFIAGIAGVSVSNQLPVVIDSSNDQLGTVTLAQGVIITDGTGPFTSITGTDGQLIIAATGAAPAFASLTSTDGSVTYTPGANSLDLSVSAAAAGAVMKLTGDAGSAVVPNGAGNINILANNLSVNCGATVAFTGTPAAFEIALSITDTALGNIFLGNLAGNITVTGGNNVGCGPSVLNALTSGDKNTAFGTFAATSLTSGARNSLFGFFSGLVLTTGDFNVGLGSDSLLSLTTGDDNVALGADALSSLVSGTNNLAVGDQAGSSLTTNDSNNILIGHTGTAGINGRIRIGTNATHTTAFIAGIAGVAVSNQLPVIIDSTTDQLGTVTLGQGVVITDGTGPLTSINGTDGQLVIAATGAAPAWASLTSTDSSVSFTPGANTLDLSVGFSALTFSTDAGNANPNTGTITISGGSNINTAGATSIVTVNLDNVVTISGDFTTTGGAVNIGTAAPANPFNLAIEQSVSGVIGASIQNVSVGAAAASQLQLIVEPATADPAVVYNVNGAATWALGIDNSDSDTYKLTTGSSPSAGTEVITCTAAGVVSFPQYTTGLVASSSAGVLSSITGTDGQLVIGATGADPVFASLASADSSVTITPGANTLDLSVAFGALTFATGSGNANPSTGTITMTGGANITTSGATSVVTIAVDPGFADNTFRIQDNGDPTKELAFEVSAITGSTTRTITMPDRDVNLTNVAESFATDGSAATPSAGVITIAGGTNITTSGSGSTVTIDASSGGLTWNETTSTGPTTMSVNNGYVADNVGTVGFTLPSTAAFGDIIRVVGKGSGGWSIGQNGGQTVYFGGTSSTTGATGTVESIGPRDCVEIVCITANNDFEIISSVGTINLT